ncbi:MAG: response regulator [Nitrospiraceae bacterium]|nr:response regulator [Nitrospiraceae bacterium]
MKVLIVEDNADDRKILKYNLEKHKCEVIEAVDGEDGLKKARTAKPDVIISDALMPKMDGFHFLREIKKIKTLSSIPFVFYSAVYTGFKEAELAISIGAEAFMIKPKDSEEFWDELNGILQDIKKRKGKQRKSLTAELITEEEEFLRKYSLVVASKLEEEVKNLNEEITNRKRMEEQLILFQDLLNQSSDSIFVIEAETGRFLTVNDNACKSLGYTQEELLGKKVMDIDISVTDDEKWKTMLEKIKKNGNKIVFEGGNKRKDNSIFPVEISAKYVPYNKKDYVVAVLRDITKRKYDEDEKKKLEEQLRHSQKMEAVGQLAGGIAHDFNNILTAILGYASLIQIKMEKGNPLRNFVDSILLSTQRATNLTHGLLSFSRKQITDLQPVNLNDIIGRIGKLLASILGEDIELKIALYKTDLIINADFSQIEQILMNLATNARDEMPNGGKLIIKTEFVKMDELLVKTFGYGEPGEYALLSVADTGGGIDPEIKDKIFEPFFTTKEVGKGTGLGLSIVYGIVRKHGGYINAYSEHGEGTIFRIYLPLVKSKAEAIKHEEVNAPQRGTETLLLAEDDADVRDLSRFVLEEFGYQIIEAVEGQDAVDKFEKHKDEIQLVIADVIMPKKSGKEVYEEIMKIKPDTKVLFVSGYSADLIEQKGILKEGINFISKPLSPTELLKKVRDMLDKH